MTIHSQAVVIRDETQVGANTATRVGTCLVDIADDLTAKAASIAAAQADATQGIADAATAQAAAGAAQADATTAQGTATQAQTDAATAQAAANVALASANVALAAKLGNCLYVSENPVGGQYATLSAAFAAVTNPSTNNPWLIVVGAGIFDESGITPVAWPAFTSVVGAGGTESQIYSSDSSASPLFSSVGNGVAAYGVYFRPLLRPLFPITNSLSTFVNCILGGSTYAIQVSGGSFPSITLSNTKVQSGGVIFIAGGSLFSDGGTYEGCPYGISVTAGSVYFQVSDAYFNNNQTGDVNVVPTGCTGYISGRFGNSYLVTNNSASLGVINMPRLGVALNNPSFCNLYMQNNAVPTTLAVAGTWYKVAGTTVTALEGGGLTTAVSSNRIDKAGNTAKYRVTVVATVTHATSTHILGMCLLKNGSEVAGSAIPFRSGVAGDYKQVTLTSIVSLASGDRIEIGMKTIAVTDDFTVTDMQVTAEAVGLTV